MFADMFFAHHSDIEISTRTQEKVTIRTHIYNMQVNGEEKKQRFKRCDRKKIWSELIKQ